MRAATLNHEIFDDSMKVQSVVESVGDEFNEIGYSVWSASVKKFDGYVPC